DVCLHFDLPPVHVERGGTSVDEHDHRPRRAAARYTWIVSVGRDVEAVHGLPVRVVELPRLVGLPLRSALSGSELASVTAPGSDHLVPHVVECHRGATALGL